MKNKVLELIIKCGLVSAPIWGLSLFLCYGKMYYSNEDFAYTFWNKQFTETKQDKYYKVVVIGDSSCNSAYMPEVISDSMINLSVGGSSTVEGYYVLKDYLAHNDAPTDVFLSYHDSHFRYTEAYWDKIVPAHRFSFMDNMELLTNAINDETGMFYHNGAYADLIATEVYFPSKYIVSLNNFLTQDKESDDIQNVRGYETNVAAMDKVELHRGRYTTLGNEVFVTSQYRPYTEFPMHPLYESYFDKTIALCQKNGIAVHIVKPPLPDNSQMSDEYIEAVKVFYNRYVEKYDNVTFDWGQHIFTAEDFADEIHLNNDGALKFSEYIKTNYHDVFEDAETYTPRQMLAIDDSIQMENMTADIFKFVGDRDYTVLLYDNMDCISEFEKSFIDGTPFKITQANDLGLTDNAGKVYYCNTAGTEVDEIEIKDDDERLLVSMPGQSDSSWSVAPEYGISIMVIDNTNQKVVCIKNVTYDETVGFSEYVY
ncbi:hypothetical protein SAMN05216351_10745 [Pseudobutyrivibrio sp. JW11]|uniref:hypothetical protein n=1 Tax=Pseudobutyrivibrio sp. JW11 TaxID=1855302 RepID=UPI0008E0226E|nr:hypothetical protein [Pseudobutyrivibrio sp. JW11]SFO35323.1 hypothetical protein SAMN05216351_10745 [Pseudobutyrivibrio sp. JW11]